MNPRVSIIMAVYNSDAFVKEAVESVQRQTFEDWELIAVDDVSQDDSVSIVQEMAETDSRIQLVQMKENGGAGAARDFAIQQARGEYIAIFDADDICMPDRLEKQLDYLQSHPDVIALGTQAMLIDAEGSPCGKKTFPTESKELHRMMYTAIPIQLPSLMVSRKMLPEDFDWFEGWRYSEDSLLFFKLAHYGKIANMPNFLVQYRYYSQSTSYRHAKTYFYETWKSRKIAKQQYGYTPTSRSRLVSGMQFLIVTLLPAPVVPWIYKQIRKGMLLLGGNNES